jgi:hypothetical protein
LNNKQSTISHGSSAESLKHQINYSITQMTLPQHLFAQLGQGVLLIMTDNMIRTYKMLSSDAWFGFVFAC